MKRKILPENEAFKTLVAGARVILVNPIGNSSNYHRAVKKKLEEKKFFFLLHATAKQRGEIITQSYAARFRQSR